MATKSTAPVRADEEPQQGLVAPIKSVSPGIISSALIILVLAAALAVTGYGLFKFDWVGMRAWPVDERNSALAAITIPTLLLIGGSFWRFWPRLAAIVVLSAGLVTYGPAVLGVVAFAGLGFIAIGQLIFRIELDSAEDGLLAMALGFGVTGLVIGFTASFRVHFDFVYSAFFIVAMLFARRPLKAWVKGVIGRLAAPIEQQTWPRVWNNLGASFALIVSIGLMLYATAMENGPDALTTHFAFTEALREFGFIPLDPERTPAVLMPKATVWGLAAVDVIGGEFALRAAHASLLAAAAALISMRAARTMGVGAAGALAATLLSAPVCLWISSQFFEETGALFFVAAAAVFFLRGEASPRPQLEDWRAFSVLGVAVSAKMQVLFLGGLGLALAVRRLLIDRSAKGFRDVAIGCLIFLVMGGGFYLRAFVMTGNPLYPIVPGETIDARWDQPLTVMTPYNMVFRTGLMEAYVGGFAFQFILLLGGALAVLFVPPGRSVRWLGFAAIVFAVGLAIQTPYARYQLYAFPLLMLCLAAVFPFITNMGRVFVSVSLVAIALLNLGFWRSVHVAPFTLAQLGAPQSTSYLAPERRAFDALDSLYGRSTVVYVAGNNPVAAGSSGQVHTISAMAKKLQAASTINNVGRILRDGGVTHIVLVGPARNPKVVEACKLVCREFPLRPELGMRLFEVNLSLASMLADRTDLPELLGMSPPPEAIPTIGWSAREEWGWWSIDKKAEVKLSGFAGGGELIVHLQPFAPPGTDGLDVKVSLDGVHLADWRFEPGPTGAREERRIQLPRPIAASDAGVLAFEFSRTYTPKATIGNGDERSLAIGLIDVTR
ncbi:MAG: hypothetical protein EOP84_00500 [Verrucomicrobiaceae bacterium]|nr:MAG: hypothetical protein EOP84_00500 [Verrucomicrobiaceae bacterium]